MITALFGILSSQFVYADAAKDAWTELVNERARSRPEFAFVENNPALPNVLIYGDSISMAYTLRVRENLKGKANVYRIHLNGGDTARIIRATKQMQEAMAEHWPFEWDVIHLNAGLHDLKYLDENGKYDTQTGTQVRSPGGYAKRLKMAIDYFKETTPEAVIIFATTTPVPEESRGRKAGDAARFNEAALSILKEDPEVVINDLYTFTQMNYAKWQAKPGDVHYNAAGSRAQGDKVAQVILSQLAKREETSR
jgi:hypothetical protein